MSRRRERRDIATLFAEMTVVKYVSRIEGARKLNTGMQWGLYRALEKLGVELELLARLEARAWKWAEGHCPANDERTYEATRDTCRRCPGRCEEWAEEIAEELVD